MKTRILVTGANGQLGKTIKKLSQKLQYDFCFVSKDELDISKKEDLKSFFDQNTFDYCINCAAYTNVEQAEKTPGEAYKINTEAVKYIAEKCKEDNIILIHISTDYVFDGMKNEPYTVIDKTNPINQYGLSKLNGEEHIKKIMQAYFIVRTSWLYSKEFGKNFYRTILNKAKTESTLYVTSAETGCPTNTINLANYIIDLINTKSEDYGVKHFCDSQAMTWFDFAERILKENNLLNQIKLVKQDNYRTFAKRPQYSVLKNS